LIFIFIHHNGRKNNETKTSKEMK